MTWVRVLLAGQLSPTKAALSGGLVSDGVITCPGHFRRFDLRTGRCLGRAWEQVVSYPCSIDDGWVQVDIGPAAPSRSLREILIAHARGLDVG